MHTNDYTLRSKNLEIVCEDDLEKNDILFFYTLFMGNVTMPFVCQQVDQLIHLFENCYNHETDVGKLCYGRNYLKVLLGTTLNPSDETLNYTQPTHFSALTLFNEDYHANFSIAVHIDSVGNSLRKNYKKVLYDNNIQLLFTNVEQTQFYGKNCGILASSHLSDIPKRLNYEMLSKNKKLVLTLFGPTYKTGMIVFPRMRILGRDCVTKTSWYDVLPPNETNATLLSDIQQLEQNELYRRNVELVLDESFNELAVAEQSPTMSKKFGDICFVKSQEVPRTSAKTSLASEPVVKSNVPSDLTIITFHENRPTIVKIPPETKRVGLLIPPTVNIFNMSRKGDSKNFYKELETYCANNEKFEVEFECGHGCGLKLKRSDNRFSEKNFLKIHANDCNHNNSKICLNEGKVDQDLLVNCDCVDGSDVSSIHSFEVEFEDSYPNYAENVEDNFDIDDGVNSNQEDDDDDDNEDDNDDEYNFFELVEEPLEFTENPDLPLLSNR